MSRIFNGIALGGVAAAAAAYSVSPVFAPGALLWAANMGMFAGGLLGSAAACIHVARTSRNYDARHSASMGAVLLGMIGTMVSVFVGVSAFDTNEDATYDALRKTVTEIYGEDFKGAAAGRIIPLRPALMGGEATPMIATFANDPQGSLYTGSSTMQFRVCAQFNVAYAATPDKTEYEYEICNARPLTQQEIGRIIPSFR